MTKGKQEMTEYALKFTALDTDGKYDIYFKECYKPEKKGEAGDLFFALRPWEAKSFRSVKSAENMLKRIRKGDWISLNNTRDEGEIVELDEHDRKIRKEWKRLKLS